MTGVLYPMKISCSLRIIPRLEIRYLRRCLHRVDLPFTEDVQVAGRRQGDSQLATVRLSQNLSMMSSSRARKQ